MCIRDSLYPVFTALICRVFFKEHMGKFKIIALVIASAGILFFFDPSGSLQWPGLVLAIASAVTYSCYMTGMDKTALRDINPNKVACYMAVSYTHLLAPHGAGLKIPGGFPRKGRALILRKGRLRGPEIAAFQRQATPVSYTHLFSK